MNKKKTKNRWLNICADLGHRKNAAYLRVIKTGTTGQTSEWRGEKRKRFQE